MTEFIITCKTGETYLNAINTLNHNTTAKFWSNGIDRILINEGAFFSKKLSLVLIKSLLVPKKCFIRPSQRETIFKVGLNINEVKMLPDTEHYTLYETLDLISSYENFYVYNNFYLHFDDGNLLGLTYENGSIVKIMHEYHCGNKYRCNNYKINELDKMERLEREKTNYVLNYVV